MEKTKLIDEKEVQKKLPNVFNIENLKVHFPINQGFIQSLKKSGKSGTYVKAVDNINLSVREGETVGLAGESGCGKTTLAKSMVKLVEPTSGKIEFNGRNLSELKGEMLKEFRSNAQMIFQDPYESLNPRFSIKQTLEEPLILQGIKSKDERKQLILETLEKVGLRPPGNYINRFPHQLSGGQRQRVAIARALVIKPKFLVADEPVSMLDVSIRASILTLLKELVHELNLTSVYISHDLSLIRYVCDKTAIMYLGRIVEMGPTEDIIRNPIHPYSQALLSSVPTPDPKPIEEQPLIEGEAPNPVNLPNGCRFHPRCPLAMDICKEVEPDGTNHNNRYVECHLFND